MKEVTSNCPICRITEPVKYYLEFKRVYLCEIHKRLWDKQDEKDRKKEHGTKTKK